MGKNTLRIYSARISHTLSYILKHLDTDLDLDHLSRVANTSKYHFHRQFSASTGISLHKFIQLSRLQAASMQLVFNPTASITQIALEAGYENTESFSRAFKKVHGQTPSFFRKSPTWKDWQTKPLVPPSIGESSMKHKVEIIDFPQTLVAALEHQGPENQVLTSSKKFIEWRKQNGIPPDKGKTFAIYYNDPDSTPPEDFHIDIAVSIDQAVSENNYGVSTKELPAGRCAKVRHFGPRNNIAAADYLYREWLPASSHQVRDAPLFFHFINVGPQVQPQDMIADVYLPII